MEKEKFLAEGYGGHGGDPASGNLDSEDVDHKCGGCVDEHEHGDGGVLEVVEMLRGYGPIFCPGLVLLGADEKLGGYGDAGAKHDEVELSVAEGFDAVREEPCP